MKKLWALLILLIFVGCTTKPIYYELPAAPGFRMHEKNHLSALADGDIVLVEDASDACATKYTLMSDIDTYIGAGDGNVTGPSTHVDGYAPLWGSVNSTNLLEGYLISAIGKLIAGDGNATAVRATIGCGSAATRSAEDTMTNGSNLSDGAAIKTYGDTNWSASGGDPGKRFAADYGFSTAASAVNNSTYFDNAVAAMSAGEVLIIPEGTSKINNVIFDPPNGCGLICYGELESNASGTAFTIGLATGTTHRDYYDIQRLRVNSESIDRSSGRIGILVRNIYNAEIDIRDCEGFETGIKLSANGTGCCYNEFVLGKIYNNKYNLHLDAENSGWTNENSFHKGGFGWQSGTNATGFRHIWIDHYATHRINSNNFYNPSLEGNPSVADATTVGIYNEGWYNCFYSPRFEMDSNATIVNFTSNARFNFVFFGYALLDMTTKLITDNGADSNFFGHDLLHLTSDIETSGKFIQGGSDGITSTQTGVTNFDIVIKGGIITSFTKN